LADPLTRDVHVTPLGDVKIFPADPTATNWVSHQATPYMFELLDLLVQEIRSVDE
jgi:hypothetical protein